MVIPASQRRADRVARKIMGKDREGTPQEPEDKAFPNMRKTLNKLRREALRGNR